MYADYAYYTSEYLLGKSPAVPEEVFKFWEKKARAEIDAYTFGRLKQKTQLIPSEVKECVCALVELLYKADNVLEKAREAGAAGPLVSYANDGESGTFDLSQSMYTESGKRDEVRKIIGQYLGNTGLLYSGVESCKRCRR